VYRKCLVLSVVVFALGGNESHGGGGSHRENGGTGPVEVRPAA
jgi:hypothetical protein